MWPTFAGHLCASHVGEWVEVEGFGHGLLFGVIHKADRSVVRLVMKQVPGGGPFDVDPETVIRLSNRPWRCG